VSLLSRFKNLIVRSSNSYSSESAAAHCRQLDSFTAMSDSELVKASDRLDHCLKQLKTQVDQLTSPGRRPNRSDHWLDGLAIAQVCQAMHERLKITGLEEQALLAAELWAKLSASMNGHYIHLVGPALFAYAQASEKTLPNRAIALYEKLITASMKQFGHIQKQEFFPLNEDLIIAEHLESSLSCLKQLAPDQFTEYESLSEQVKMVLAKEKDPDWIEGPIHVQVQSNGRIRCPRCGFNFIHRSEEQDCPACELQVIAK